MKITKKDGVELEEPIEVDTSSICPEDYGCKPGVITWEYLDALWHVAFPEEGECERK